MTTPAYPGGPHLILVTLGPLLGTQAPDPRSDYGFALYVGVMPQGGATLEQAASVKHYLMETPKDGRALNITSLPAARGNWSSSTPPNRA
jgi:hypothetical protein